MVGGLHFEVAEELEKGNFEVTWHEGLVAD